MDMSQALQYKLAVYDRWVDYMNNQSRMAKQIEDRAAKAREEKRSNIYLEMAVDNHFRQIAKDEAEKKKLAYDRKRQSIIDEEKRNDDMISFFWTAMTDENTTDAERKHFQSLAQNFIGTLNPQQQAKISGVVKRSLFDPTDKKKEVFQRLHGKRPAIAIPENSVDSPQALQTFAEQKVEQEIYDYNMRAFIAGGKDKLNEPPPNLIPIGAIPKDLVGADGTTQTVMSNIFAYKDSMTGQVKTLDTAADLDTNMYNSAIKKGFGPTMMQRWDFIPFENSMGEHVTIGDKQYKIWTGVKLTTGESIVRKIELGDVPDKDRKPATPPGQAMDIIAWANSVRDGVDIEKTGKYYGWVKRLQGLENKAIPKEDYEKNGLPKLQNSEGKLNDYGTYLINLQQAFNAQFPGWVIAPTEHLNREQGGVGILWPFKLDKYYAEDSVWQPIPADGLRAVMVDGVEQSFWYKENNPDGTKHTWYNFHGQRQKDLDTVPPL